MSEPVLVAHEVEVTYPGASAPALTPTSLAVEAQDAIGIVGESGSGKTTLAKALVGLLKPTGGRVEAEGRAWSSVRRREPLRRHVQMIFQDPYASVNPSMTARNAVAEVFRVWDRVSRREAAERAETLLAEVGLPRDAFDRRPGALSGGQCQRVGIARALACSPRVLVADEPTSSLDVSVQAQILNLLLELRRTRHLALVLISHDLAVVRYVTERALVMYGGRVVERGPTAQLFDDPAHPYTRALVDAIPGREGETRLVRNDVPATGCIFAARCHRLGSGCVERTPVLPDASRAAACFYPLSAAAVPPPLELASIPGRERVS